MGYCEHCDREVTSKFCPGCGKEIQSTSASQENISSLVNELYALRAGLSLVAQERDSADAAQEVYDRKEFYFNNTTNQFNVELNDQAEKYQSVLKGKKDANKNTRKEMYDEQFHMKYRKEDFVKSIFALCVGLLITIAVVVGMSIAYSYAKEPFILVAAGFMGICGLAVCGFLSSNVAGNYGSYKDSCNKYAELSSKYIDESVIDSVLEGDTDLVRISQAYYSIEQKKQKHIETGLYSELEIKNQKIAVHTETGMEIYNSLVPHYSKILDERDWQNLDLVIFMLETRRADSIKEALHLVDRARQTEQIVNMITSATQTICGTINRGFSFLQDSMVKCATILSSQLSAINRTQEIILDEVSSTKRAVLASNDLNKQLSAALAAKSSVSSEQLMDDVHQLRIYAENDAIKRRNS
ncbi:MAG: hypothetical protein IJ309_04405 [Clostridia bacterium]|nr:hypothetical protein [Clostridia bacterium]